MKKQMISVCVATVLAASMVAGGAVQAFAASASTADEAAPAVVSVYVSPEGNANILSATDVYIS